MVSSSPLDNLSPTLSKPLEDALDEKTDSNGTKEPEESDRQPEAAVSPPADEVSSEDEGPEDCVPTRKATKASGTRSGPSPKNPSSKSKAPTQSKVRICPFCREWPIDGPYEFCSVECEKGAGIAKRKAVFRVLKPLKSKDRVAQAISHKFHEEWIDPTGELETPQIEVIFNISLPYYEDRFLDAIARAQAHGGSNTKSAWFACQCICDVGVTSEDLCIQRSCGICMVVKSGFDELAFGKATNNGTHGEGIYAHLNPAMAHRFTVRKADHNSRVMILCSIVELEPGAPVDNVFDYGALIEDSGRVFCAKKDLIIPRRLVVYSVAQPTERPTGDMDID